MPTQNAEIFLLLCVHHLYLVPLRIAVHIYWPRCLSFPYLSLLCVWYVHRKSITASQQYGALCRNNTERGHNEETKGRWKQQVWIFGSRSCRKSTFTPQRPRACLQEGPCGMQGRQSRVGFRLLLFLRIPLQPMWFGHHRLLIGCPNKNIHGPHKHFL